MNHFYGKCERWGGYNIHEVFFRNNEFLFLITYQLKCYLHVNIKAFNQLKTKRTKRKSNPLKLSNGEAIREFPFQLNKSLPAENEIACVEKYVHI